MAATAGGRTAATPALVAGSHGRHRRGEVPSRARARGSRSYADIVWSNTFTLFNLILGGLLGLILVFGDWRDGLFGGVIVANTLVGIVQEVRAKRTLDRLALLVAPTARVVRGATVEVVAPDQVAVGDLVHLEPGDQVVADGRVEGARGLSIDESVLTGESVAVHKAVGEAVLSGSYCVAGSGQVRVEAVGADSYAERLAVEAQGTRRDLSPLQRDINRVLRLTVWAMLPLSTALVVSHLVRDDSLVASVPKIVAALVPLVPEGLVLLTSMTFAVAAVRLARLGAFTQRLNAVESLAGVDVVCVDKTGTLTDNRLAVWQVCPAPGVDQEHLQELVGAFAASVGDRNGTMRAIFAAFPAEPHTVVAEVPFTSDTKWSGITMDDLGNVVIGAPDVLARLGVGVDDGLATMVAGHQAARRRVVMVARGPVAASATTLGRFTAEGIVVLSEGVRDDAIATVRFLREQGLTIKVISGDAPATVAAVAATCGIPDADRAVAGEQLPADPAGLARLVDQTTVFGRIVPEQKREIVAGLVRAGHHVAMIGDGVNDVLALKEANLAIAMGSGSQIAKGVSDLVLVRGGFATVPAAVEEGRRILRNTQRVAQLFVTKSVYAAVLLATVGLAPIAFPFLPRHLTVTASLTIGIPAFFLALASSTGPVRRDRFVRDLLRFAVPAGLVIGASIVSGYLVARGPLDRTITDARTAAVIVATGLGLMLVVAIERAGRGVVRWWVWLMVSVFVLAFTVGLAVRPLRDFFAVSLPDAELWGLALATVGVGAAVMVGVERVAYRLRWGGPTGGEAG